MSAAQVSGNSRTSTPGLTIEIGASWSGARVAAELVGAAATRYGDDLPIGAIQSAMDEIWLDLHADFTPEERARIGEVAYVSIPTNELNANISVPPSGDGNFIMFDVMLDLRLSEIFTAPRNPAAWAACYVRAAWGDTVDVAHWVGPAVNRLMAIKQGPFPDSFGLMEARNFIFAHECGHFFLNHLRRGFDRTMRVGEEDLRVFDPYERDELAADRFARDLLCRRNVRSIALQRLGVDWMLGFVSAIAAMRRRAHALMQGLPDVSPSNPSIDRRRAQCWADYSRRCAAAPDAGEHEGGNMESARRLRANVDNFNADGVTLALPLIYAAAPEELMKWAKAVRNPMADQDFVGYLQQLRQLGVEALSRAPFVATRRQRLLAWFKELL